MLVPFTSLLLLSCFATLPAGAQPPQPPSAVRSPAGAQAQAPARPAAEKATKAGLAVTPELLAKSAYLDGRSAQSKPTLKKFIEGPHTISAKKAVAGIEVAANRALNRAEELSGT